MQRTLFLLFLVLAGCGGGDHVQFTVLFPETKTLDPGAEVYLDGEQVGEVVSSDPRLEERGEAKVTVLEAKLKVEKRFADLITKDSTFTVKRVPPLVGSRRVEIEKGNGDLISAGETLDGQGPLWSRMRDWGREMGSLATSDEMRQRFRDFAEEARDVARQGREEWERRAPELHEQAADLIEQAREFGPKVTEWIQSHVQAILDALEKGEEVPEGTSSDTGDWI